jgi:hypothetical protein
MKLVELGLVGERRRSGGLASDEDHSVTWFCNSTSSTYCEYVLSQAILSRFYCG